MEKISQRKVAAVAALLLCCFLAPDISAKEKSVVIYPKVNYADYIIEAGDKTAKVEAEFEIEGEAGQKFLVLHSPCALLETQFSNKHLKLGTFVFSGGKVISYRPHSIDISA